MHALAVTAQLAVAASVAYVWIFSHDTIVKDFERFGFAPLFRNAVGVVKTTLGTLLVVGIWMPALVLPAALGMAAMMVGAQWAHAKVSNPVARRVPSAALLALCAFVMAEATGRLG